MLSLTKSNVIKSLVESNKKAPILGPIDHWMFLIRQTRAKANLLRFCLIAVEKSNAQA